MKTYGLLFFASLFIALSGCRKDTNSTVKDQTQDTSLVSAIAFLKVNLSKENFAILDLASNRKLKYRNKTIGVQIFEKNASHNKFMILVEDPNTYTGNWVDMSDLKTASGSIAKSGSMTIESLDKKIETKIIVNNNKVTQLITGGKSTLISYAGNLSAEKKLNINDALAQNKSTDLKRAPTVLPEIDITVYVDNGRGEGNGGGGDDLSFSSLYWFLGQNSSYASYYFENNGNVGEEAIHGSERNNGDNVSTAPTFISPDKPISDIRNELKCFTNDIFSTYTIAVNVNQPHPNTRKIYDLFLDHPVGHTFLTLKQTGADGSVITRNVGFYPKNHVKPGSEIDKSTFADDSQTPYDITLQINVSGSDYFTVINALIMQQSKDYDLNNFNCTNSAIDALNTIGINLPSTKSTDALFDGNSPADLGEDIRALDLNNFSSEHGNRRVSRSESDSNDKQAPSREGEC